MKLLVLALVLVVAQGVNLRHTSGSGSGKGWNKKRQAGDAPATVAGYDNNEENFPSLPGAGTSGTSGAKTGGDTIDNTKAGRGTVHKAHNEEKATVAGITSKKHAHGSAGTDTLDTSEAVADPNTHDEDSALAIEVATQLLRLSEEATKALGQQQASLDLRAAQIAKFSKNTDTVESWNAMWLEYNVALQGTLTAVSSDVSTLEETVSAAETRLTLLKDTAKAEEAKLMKVTNAGETSETALRKLQSEIANIQKTLEKCQGGNDAGKEKIAAAKAKMTELKAALLGIETAHEELTNHIETAKAETAENTVKVKALKGEWAAAKTTNDASMAELEKQTDHLAKKLRSSLKMKAMLETAGVDAEFRQVNPQLKEKRAERFRQLRVELTAMQEECSKAFVAPDGAKPSAGIKRLHMCAKKLEKLSTALDTKEDKLEADKSGGEKKLTASIAKNAELQAEMTATNAQLTTAEENILVLGHTISESEQTIDQHLKLLRETEDKLVKAINRVKELKTQREDLAESLNLVRDLKDACAAESKKLAAEFKKASADNDAQQTATNLLTEATNELEGSVKTALAEEEASKQSITAAALALENQKNDYARLTGTMNQNNDETSKKLKETQAVNKALVAANDE